MSWVHFCQEMKKHLTRKVGFEGTPKLDPYWKSQPVSCKVNMECTQTILTRGSEFLMDWTSWSRTQATTRRFDNNEQETFEMQFEDFALKTNVLAFASRPKAKAKPRRRTPASSSAKTIVVGERKWTDIEPEDYSPIAYPVSKQLSTLLHGHLPREEDGAIEFWRFKEYLRNDLVQSQHWSDNMWKSTMAKGGGNKKRFQYCTDPSGQEILYLRALQDHSGRNPTDPTLQDNVFIPDNFFEYIHHIGCAINLHPITNSGLIPRGRNLSKRQTVFFTAVNPMDKEHKDPYKLDMTQPLFSSYKQKWKRHQDTV